MIELRYLEIFALSSILYHAIISGIYFLVLGLQRQKCVFGHVRSSEHSLVEYQIAKVARFVHAVNKKVQADIVFVGRTFRVRFPMLRLILARVLLCTFTWVQGPVKLVKR